MAKNDGLKLLNRIKGKNQKRLKEIKRKFFPTEFLNEEIELLDSQLEQYMQLQRHYCDYYQHKRLQRKDLISEVITKHSSKAFELDSAWRVVSHQFSQDPLCTIGSVMRPPGGRFNFGKGLEGYENFHCLYLGSSSQTALVEKYHGNTTFDGEEISQEFLSLDVDETHTNFKIKLSLENVLDLREETFFKDFLDCISDIEDPKQLNNVAKFNSWSPHHSLRTLDSLKDSLFDPKYTNYGMTYGIPSNSQWLGYMCYQQGVQGIIYPSVRYKDGFNVAVFIDNFKNSKLSHVRLKDEINYITVSRRSVTQSNISEIKKPEEL